jgi:hypothetical protein
VSEIYRVAVGFVPEVQARMIGGAVLGLSLAVLLGHLSPREALDVLGEHCAILRGGSTPR